MILRERSLLFEFPNALAAFKFDEQDSSLDNFHGLSHCMKAVDFIVEYKDRYYFIEIKDPGMPGVYAEENDLAKLISDLTIKYRDTFMYRWAERKLDKPVYYLCFIELENALILNISRNLKRRLPIDKPSTHWKRPIVKECLVSNIAIWNQTFPDMKVTRV
jgi:hypothetical protein